MRPAFASPHHARNGLLVSVLRTALVRKDHLDRALGHRGADGRLEAGEGRVECAALRRRASGRACARPSHTQQHSHSTPVLSGRERFGVNSSASATHEEGPGGDGDIEPRVATNVLRPSLDAFIALASELVDAPPACMP